MAGILEIILLTFLPFLELRASIPFGIFSTDLSLTTIFTLCVLTNIALAPLLYFFLHKFVHLFLRIDVFNRIYQKTVITAQKRVQKYVKKYGVLGLALFIGVPLPGSGVYSGALGAYVLGFRFQEFYKAAILGVLIAGVIVLLVSVAGDSVFSFLIKMV